MGARIQTVTLEGDTVKTITLDKAYNYVEVLNVDGAEAVYLTVDASGSPTVAGDGCDVLPPAIGSLDIRAPGQASTVVKLISSGTPTVSVKGEN